MDTAPRVGDKVLYRRKGDPGHPAWEDRTEQESLVIAVDESDTHGTIIRCWELWPGLHYDREWAAKIENIIVTQRAEYHPVEVSE